MAYSLVCPFLTDDPLYAHGVEFGMLFERMRFQDMPGEEISDYFTTYNQEQIFLLANRLGWEVSDIKSLDEYWFYCVLKKKAE